MSIESDVREAQAIILKLTPEQQQVIRGVFTKFKDIALELDKIPEALLQVTVRVVITLFTRRVTGWGAKGTEDKILAGGDVIFVGHENTVRETVRAIMGAKI